MSGSPIETPTHIWAGKQWNEALRFNKITFPYGLGGSAVGRPIIVQNALEDAFNSNATARSTGEIPSAQEAAMPRHQYRTRLLEVLEEIWSGIDATDWEAKPPKKVAIENDLINRFSLTKREAGIIATMFVPDERRGKTKKG